MEAKASLVHWVRAQAADTEHDDDDSIEGGDVDSDGCLKVKGGPTTCDGYENDSESELAVGDEDDSESEAGLCGDEEVNDVLVISGDST